MPDQTPAGAVPATPRRLNAYYYGFGSTGVDAIDAVLEAVARAGKGYHNTEDWNNEDENGETAAWRIQEAANTAAKALAALSSQVQQLTRELDAAKAKLCTVFCSTCGERVTSDPRGNLGEKICYNTECSQWCVSVLAAGNAP